jgi:starvation-inducible DNA-binding protein
VPTEAPGTRAVLTDTPNPPLPDEACAEIGKHLQLTLVELIALSLAGKQLQWTSYGREFVGMHRHLGGLVEDWRALEGAVAERAAAIGIALDGTAAAVVELDDHRPLEPGFTKVGRAIERLYARLWDVALRVRRRSEVLSVSTSSRHAESAERSVSHACSQRRHSSAESRQCSWCCAWTSHSSAHARHAARHASSVLSCVGGWGSVCRPRIRAVATHASAQSRHRRMQWTRSPTSPSARHASAQIVQLTSQVPHASMHRASTATSAIGGRGCVVRMVWALMRRSSRSGEGLGARRRSTPCRPGLREVGRRVLQARRRRPLNARSRAGEPASLRPWNPRPRAWVSQLTLV